MITSVERERCIHMCYACLEYIYIYIYTHIYIYTYIQDSGGSALLLTCCAHGMCVACMHMCPHRKWPRTQMCSTVCGNIVVTSIQWFGCENACTQQKMASTHNHAHSHKAMVALGAEATLMCMALSNKSPEEKQKCREGKRDRR